MEIVFMSRCEVFWQYMCSSKNLMLETSIGKALFVVHFLFYGYLALLCILPLSDFFSLCGLEGGEWMLSCWSLSSRFQKSCMQFSICHTASFSGVLSSLLRIFPDYVGWWIFRGFLEKTPLLSSKWFWLSLLIIFHRVQMWSVVSQTDVLKLKSRKSLFLFHIYERVHVKMKLSYFSLSRTVLCLV